MKRAIPPEDPAGWPPLLGMASLMRRAEAGENLLPLGQALLARALRNPRDAHACLDFSTVLLLTGNREHGLAVQDQAIRLRPLYALPARRAEGLRLLVFMGPGDLMANTPVELLVEDSDVSLHLLYLRPDAEWPDTVPDHDVALVAVGESDDSQPLLARLAEYVADWPRPVINRPECIARLSRDRVSAALRGVPGVEMPVTVRVGRAELRALADGNRSLAAILPDGAYPVIVRPAGSHAGTQLEKLAAAEALAGYLERSRVESFYLSRFVDYRSTDGRFRKYRIVLIEGKPCLCHLAVSGHWMIHYANAGMHESGEKRAEEARCMERFDADFALRHAAALQAIHERMELPYVGIDCAETPEGRLLVFEVDNSMVVHALDSEDLFPYKKPAMDKVFAGFRRLLENARRPAAAG
jgi:glutathione synthase/RimK-type ligase-like ATP-grasp enzyme